MSRSHSRLTDVEVKQRHSFPILSAEHKSIASWTALPLTTSTSTRKRSAAMRRIPMRSSQLCDCPVDWTTLV